MNQPNERPVFEQVILQKEQHPIAKEIFEAGKEFAKLVSDYYSHCGNSPKEHEEFFRPVIKAMLSRQWCFNSLYTDMQFTKNFSDNIIREKTKQLLEKSAS